MSLAQSLYWSAYRQLLTSHSLHMSTSAYLTSDASRLSGDTEAALRHMLQARRSNRTLPAAFSAIDAAMQHDELANAWGTAPVLTRQGLEEMTRTWQPHRRDSLIRTGGSTGEPVGLYINSEGMRNKRSRLLAARQAIGWEPGMVTFTVWGSDADIGKSDQPLTRLQHRLANLHVDGGFSASTQRWLRLADAMEAQRGPIALYGYSTLLADFARTLLAEGRSLRPGLVKTVWNGAEGLDERTCEFVQEAMGVDIHDFYGARETGTVAVATEANGPLRVAGPSVLVEVVDDAGLRVPRGEQGRVLVSLLQHSGAPLLRYENGDLAVAGDQTTFGHHTLLKVVGRSTEIVPLPGGGQLLGLFFNHAVKDYPSIRHFQARVYPASRRLHFLYVADVSDPPQVAALKRTIEAKLTGYQVTMKGVDVIERTAHGKLRQVIVSEEPQ